MKTVEVDAPQKYHFSINRVEELVFLIVLTLFTKITRPAVT